MQSLIRYAIGRTSHIYVFFTALAQVLIRGHGDILIYESIADCVLIKSDVGQVDIFLSGAVCAAVAVQSKRSIARANSK
jgi:polynucleotide 5'-kinase involved in rRNA processing